ncbi:hypothetical protein G7046_g4868 [Stylonectria norvegica]|nr:hypothetical protein G7046_g4868 [Stylonectria norvegica]
MEKTHPRSLSKKNPFEASRSQGQLKAMKLSTSTGDRTQPRPRTYVERIRRVLRSSSLNSSISPPTLPSPQQLAIGERAGLLRATGASGTQRSRVKTPHAVPVDPGGPARWQAGMAMTAQTGAILLRLSSFLHYAQYVRGASKRRAGALCRRWNWERDRRLVEGITEAQTNQVKCTKYIHRPSFIIRRPIPQSTVDTYHPPSYSLSAFRTHHFLCLDFIFTTCFNLLAPLYAIIVRSLGSHISPLHPQSDGIGLETPALETRIALPVLATHNRRRASARDGQGAAAMEIAVETCRRAGRDISIDFFKAGNGNVGLWGNLFACPPLQRERNTLDIFASASGL